MGESLRCKQQHGTVTLSDIFGSADLGESPMHFCYSRQVAMIRDKKIGMRMDRKWLLLLLRREAVLRKIRLQGEDMVVKRDYGLYILSTHLGLVGKL
jgi:hypothetical protein